MEIAQTRKIPFEKLKDNQLGENTWLGQIGSEIVIAASRSRRKGDVVMGPHGPLGATAKAIRLRNLTGAQGIESIGMAFGVDPTSQTIGDVLVSRSLIPYENRIVSDDPGPSTGFRYDYSEVRREPARPSLVELFGYESERRHSFQVHLGSILSGATRIHSARCRAELVRAVPQGVDPVVGGDMKSVGLFAASWSVDDPIWCMVKGISDFADSNRDAVIGKSRSVACLNAADLVFSALLNSGTQRQYEIEGGVRP